MFAKCPKINLRRCGFATKRKSEVYCGIVTGPKEAAKVSNMPECAKIMTKSELTRYAKGFAPKFR